MWLASEFGSQQEEVFLHIVVSFLDARSLARMACTSRGMRIACADDALWKKCAQDRWPDLVARYAATSSGATSSVCTCRSSSGARTSHAHADTSTWDSFTQPRPLSSTRRLTKL